MISRLCSRRLFPLSATLTLSALLALSIACGDDDDGGGGATATTPATSSETIDVSLDDFSFDPAAITVTAGETVTFALTNVGAAPHNMRIAGPDGEYETDDDAVSDPDTLRKDSTGALTWTAPDDAGEIQFRCDFHPAQMTGTITVE